MLAYVVVKNNVNVYVMSSKTIIQGDDKAVVPTEGQTSDHDNTEEGVSTVPKPNINLKINVVHETQEDPTTLHSNSLSSLDELAARLEQQYKEKNNDTVVIDIDENLNDTLEKSENHETETKNSTEEIKDDQISGNLACNFTSSGYSNSLENVCGNVSNNPDHIQAISAHFTPDPSTCTVIAYSSTKSRSNSLASLKKLLEKEKERLEDEESFITVEGCIKEKTTSTDVPTIFSHSIRTQNVIMESRNQMSTAPPPYEYSQHGNQYRGQQDYNTPVPVYQAQYDGQHTGYQQVSAPPPPPPPPPPRDTSRAPPYRRRSSVHYAHVEDMFLLKEIRNQFVRKVYTILSVQLLFSFGFIFLATHVEKIKYFLIRLWPLMVVATIVYVITTIALHCYQQVRRTFPMNFILLSLLTCAMTYFTAGIACFYETEVVMLTMGCTAGICILISLLAYQNWCDVTRWGIVLCLATIIILIYGVIAIIITMLTGSQITYLIYACLITLVLCAYLMYDTQQILGGRRIEMSPEEYILGAITLYVDIMILFQYLLYIISYFWK